MRLKIWCDRDLKNFAKFFGTQQGLGHAAPARHAIQRQVENPIQRLHLCKIRQQQQTGASTRLLCSARSCPLLYAEADRAHPHRPPPPDKPVVVFFLPPLLTLGWEQQRKKGKKWRRWARCGCCAARRRSGWWARTRRPGRARAAAAPWWPSTWRPSAASSACRCASRASASSPAPSASAASWPSTAS